MLCLASLCANLWLARELQSAFVKLQLGRIFPLGDADVVRRGGSDGAARPGLDIWGDSRAEMWDVGPLASAWNVRKHGIGGSTSAQLRLQIASSPAPRSAVALVQIGINDLHPLGALPAYRARVLAQLRDSLAAVRSVLLERSDVVVLSTVFPPGPVPWSRRASWDPEVMKEIDQVNEVIRASADGKRVLLLDAHAVLRDADGTLAPEYVDRDFFLHVNARAYARLNAALSQVLAQAARPRS